jgi:hypothetical protein
MPEEEKSEEEKKKEELEKFSQLASALFRVDRKDVPKHEPKKRKKPATR